MKKAATKKATKKSVAKIHKSNIVFSEFGQGMNAGTIRNAFWKARGWKFPNARYHHIDGWPSEVTAEFSWFLNELAKSGQISLTQCEHTRLCSDEFKNAA